MLLGTFISKHSLQDVNHNVPKTCNLIGKSMINALRAVQGANGTHGRQEGNQDKQEAGKEIMILNTCLPSASCFQTIKS